MADKGKINDVRWNGPAFKAGVSTGATIVAVNGQDYSDDVLKSAIAAAKGGKAPIQLLLKYPGRLPHGVGGLPRRPAVPAPGSGSKGTPDYLSEIIAARH